MVNDESATNEQEVVSKLFDTTSDVWTKLYHRKDVFAIIHQQRQQIALKLLDDLSLPKSANILEIGCGAGFVTLALAKRGFVVEALDCAPEMIKVTRQHAKRAELDGKIHTGVGDVHNLGFPDESFELVVALGVTPWLHNLNMALFEIARVLKNGGYVILNADNIMRLNRLVDPLLSPIFESRREWMMRKLLKENPRGSKNFVSPHMYLINVFDTYLREANLKNIKNSSLGFGPFTFLRRNIFSDRSGVMIHQQLQRFADMGFPILRSMADQYIVLAKKEIKN